MAIERLFNEVRKLPLTERYKLRTMLGSEEISIEDIEASKKMAGGWSDIDADKLIEDIYREREDSSRRAEVNW
ncbi:hypothetical protein DK28_0213850 [Peptococcaceae bacterium SCADC1_2_3]|jgi:hypothetical protein|nr:hypothetical protein DK28_0213850 [Peptococcaceae bacterium SCADC1_2_3]KFI36150.1 hypothetical protein HY00_05860 [Peptococcaceae bacterium SCADC1_2_3]